MVCRDGRNMRAVVKHGIHSNELHIYKKYNGSGANLSIYFCRALSACLRGRRKSAVRADLSSRAGSVERRRGYFVLYVTAYRAVRRTGMSIVSRSALWATGLCGGCIGANHPRAVRASAGRPRAVRHFNRRLSSPLRKHLVYALQPVLHVVHVPARKAPVGASPGDCGVDRLLGEVGDHAV